MIHGKGKPKYTEDEKFAIMEILERNSGPISWGSYVGSMEKVSGLKRSAGSLRAMASRLRKELGISIISKPGSSSRSQPVLDALRREVGALEKSYQEDLSKKDEVIAALKKENEVLREYCRRMKDLRKAVRDVERAVPVILNDK